MTTGDKNPCTVQKIPRSLCSQSMTLRTDSTKVQMTNKVQYISILMGSKALKPHWISYEGSCSISGLRHALKQMRGIS